MTAAQEDALESITHLLREHFVAGVCVVMTESDDEVREQIQSIHHGGLAKAVGMLEISRMSLIAGGRTR